MKWKKILLIVSSLCFILLNTAAIYKEFFLIPSLSALLIVAYLLIFRVDLLLYLMAFITPLSVPLSDEKINIGLSVPSEPIMILVTVLFLCRILYDISLDRKLLKHPLSICIFVYLFWLFITSVTSQIPLVSFKALASKIWFITSSYFMVIQLIKKDLKNAVTFFNCYAVGLSTVVVITTVKHAMRGFSERSAHWVMSPFYNDHTAYGAVLAFFLPILIGFLFLPNNTKKEIFFYVINISVVLVGLYLSFSRAAWISVVVAVFVWLLVKLKIKFSWFFFGTLFIAGVLFFTWDDIVYKMKKNQQDSSGKLVEQLQSISNITTDASNVERLNRWTAAFGMIKEKPVLGWGPGTYQFVYAPYQKGQYRTIISTDFGDGGNAHSEYIGPCAETGFIGAATVLIMFILSIFYGIIGYIRSKNKTAKILSLSMTIALISYDIHGIMNNFLDTDKLALPFWAAFAVIVVVNVFFKDEKSINP